MKLVHVGRTVFVQPAARASHRLQWLSYDEKFVCLYSELSSRSYCVYIRCSYRVS